MNQYITGKLIKELREKKKITQQELADKINISAKTISKWETGNGFPDVSILEDLAASLEVSVSELFIGDKSINTNVCANMLKTGFYICPICGNIITSTGDMFVSCHGINLVKEEAIENQIEMDLIEDDLFVSINSPMRKNDYISFIAGLYVDGISIIKLYPEQNAEVRLKRRGLKKIYYYSKREGLYYSNINIKK